jgi:hypothetical protein
MRVTAVQILAHNYFDLISFCNINQIGMVVNQLVVGVNLSLHLRESYAYPGAAPAKFYIINT